MFIASCKALSAKLSNFVDVSTCIFTIFSSFARANELDQKKNVNTRCSCLCLELSPTAMYRAAFPVSLSRVQLLPQFSIAIVSSTALIDKQAFAT